MTSDASRLTAYSFLVVFANDRVLDANELAMLERIALRDGLVDEDEKARLQDIFARAAEHDLDAGVRAEIERFRGRHGF